MTGPRPASPPPGRAGPGAPLAQTVPAAPRSSGAPSGPRFSVAPPSSAVPAAPRSSGAPPGPEGPPSATPTGPPSATRPSAPPGRGPATAAPDLPPVVEFRDVRKAFNPGTPKEFVALDGLSFRVEDIPDYGEFIAVVGPSGCGKSTVLNLIEGFPEVHPPTSGEVLVRGRPVTGPGKDRGMIFQKYSSFPHLSVLGNVMFGLNLNAVELGLSRSAREDLAGEWIRRVGLGGHERKVPRELSGGQQQRVAIARALVLKPRIILMDEPFSALDEPTRIDMQRLIMDLWHEVQATVLIVTHSIVEAVYLGDRVWIFTPSPGRIGAEFRGEIPFTRNQDPLEAQSSAGFKEIVARVAQRFREIEQGAKTQPKPA